MILDVALSVVASLVVIWLVLVVVLAVTRPEQATLTSTARILPDTVRLIRRLAADGSLHRGVRVRLWCLLVYLVLPIDIIPDFIPVIGYADDAIITSLVLRSVIRRAGADAVRVHWPGTPDGLDALARLCRIPALRAEAGADTGARAALATDEPDAPPPPAEPPLAPDDRARLLRRGFTLEGITLGWNVVGIVVLAIAAVTARSVALGGFGLDSLIEIGASTVVIWELSGTGEHRQRTALRIIGVAFIVLAAYLAIQSTWALVTAHHPHPSPLGIGWTAVTAAVMFALAAGKARTGRALDNPVLRTEGRVTLVDGLLATAVLTGLVLNAAFGWWWADPVAGYVILVYGLKEGLHAVRAPADPEIRP